MIKALSLLVLLVTTTFASILQDGDVAVNKIADEVEHHRHHRHRQCHSHRDCECPWKEGKNRAKVLSQKYLDLMFSRDYATAATFKIPTLSHGTVTPRCPDGRCCVSGDDQAYMAYFVYSVSFKQMEKPHQVIEHGRSGYEQSYEVVVPANFYLNPFKELAMNVHITWVWQEDCNLKISAVGLSDIRCLSEGGCMPQLKHNWYPTAQVIPTCTTECVNFASILSVGSLSTSTITTTTPIPTTVVSTSTTVTTSTSVTTSTTISTSNTTVTSTVTETTTRTVNTTITVEAKAFPTDAE